jgi:hypothetical protein
MKYFLLGMFIAMTYIGTFYLGYIFSIDIFELICFRTDLPTL